LLLTLRIFEHSDCAVVEQIHAICFISLSDDYGDHSLQQINVLTHFTLLVLHWLELGTQLGHQLLLDLLEERHAVHEEEDQQVLLSL
jgi:hypothetical protein